MKRYDDAPDQLGGKQGIPMKRDTFVFGARSGVVSWINKSVLKLI